MTYIANIVWGLDIEAVVVDGVVTEAWSILAPAIRQEFPADPELFQFRHLVLRPCSMGRDAPLAGSLSLAFQDFFARGGRRKLSIGLQSANRTRKEGNTGSGHVSTGKLDSLVRRAKP